MKGMQVKTQMSNSKHHLNGQMKKTDIVDTNVEPLLIQMWIPSHIAREVSIVLTIWENSDPVAQQFHS